MRIIALCIVVMFMVAGCGGTTVTPTPTPDGIVDTASELTTRVREQDFVVQKGGPFSDFLFERGGQLLRVNGYEVYVWEFPTVEEAEAARTHITGADSPLARIDFSAAPRFFQNGRMMVLFVETNRPVLNVLIALLGNPFL